MAKYKVQVRVIAEATYTVEIDARRESEAENDATGMWREKLPSDFQVEKGYISDFETEIEQLTADCPECGVEHKVPTNDDSGLLPGHSAFSRKLGASWSGSPDRNSYRPDIEWWFEDQDYCAACGVILEAREANAPNHEGRR